MAARTFLLFISLLYLVNFTNAFSLQHVMARLNAIEAKFDMLDMENKLRRTETEELFRRVSEMSTGGKMITARDHVPRDASSDYGEHVSPKDHVARLDRITVLPHKDMNKTTENALELQKLKYYLTEGAKVEKDKNLKLRTELKGIGNVLKTDFTMLESNIKEEIRNLTNNLSENQKSLEIDYASFKSNIKDFVTTALSIASNESRQAITALSIASNESRQAIIALSIAINESRQAITALSIASDESRQAITALSIASNESRKEITSLKSDYKKSVSVISNNVSTVSESLANINNRQTEIEMSMQEFSNSMNKTLSNIKDVRSEFQSSNQEFVQSLCTMDAFYANTEKRRFCRHFPYSGVYKIYLCGKSVSSVRVYCDQTTDGGGWLVFQRRQDGSVDFERTWADYKTGFGNLEGEFWLGNDNLHALTSSGFTELRIDLEDFEWNKAYAKYSHFKVKSENEKYELEVIGYSGDAGDSLDHHNGMSFSTKDRDNDRCVINCSVRWRGAWWYNGDYPCHVSNLNGYYIGAKPPGGHGVIWRSFKGSGYSLKRVEMKIR